MREGEVASVRGNWRFEFSLAPMTEGLEIQFRFIGNPSTAAYVFLRNDIDIPRAVPLPFTAALG